MSPMRLICRHDLRLLMRNHKMLGSFALGIGIILLLVLANAKERGAAELAGPLLFLFVGAAVAAPISVAVHGVVGEKERRTMEPLLLLPISAGALMAGKALVTLLLSLAGLAFVYLVAFLTLPLVGGEAAAGALTDPRLIYTACVLAPLSVIPFSLLALAVSARAPDAQTASATSFIILVPVWVVLFGVWMGMIGVNQRFLGVSTVVLLGLCWLTFAVAVRSVDPEALIRRRK